MKCWQKRLLNEWNFCEAVSLIDFNCTLMISIKTEKIKLSRYIKRMKPSKNLSFQQILGLFSLNINSIPSQLKIPFSCYKINNSQSSSEMFTSHSQFLIFNYLNNYIIVVAKPPLTQFAYFRIYTVFKVRYTKHST